MQLKDIVKECEQKIRKHDQEMESLTFRNDQLTKRISVLQQELLSNNHSKKTKGKLVETITHPNLSVLDEELHKKIIENAQLISLVSLIETNNTIYLLKAHYKDLTIIKPACMTYWDYLQKAQLILTI